MQLPMALLLVLGVVSGYQLAVPVAPQCATRSALAPLMLAKKRPSKKNGIETNSAARHNPIGDISARITKSLASATSNAPSLNGLNARPPPPPAEETPVEKLLSLFAPPPPPSPPSPQPSIRAPRFDSPPMQLPSLPSFSNLFPSNAPAPPPSPPDLFGGLASFQERVRQQAEQIKQEARRGEQGERGSWMAGPHEASTPHEASPQVPAQSQSFVPPPAEVSPPVTSADNLDHNLDRQAREVAALREAAAAKVAAARAEAAAARMAAALAAAETTPAFGGGTSGVAASDPISTLANSLEGGKEGVRAIGTGTIETVDRIRSETVDKVDAITSATIDAFDNVKNSALSLAEKARIIASLPSEALSAANIKVADVLSSMGEIDAPQQKTNAQRQQPAVSEEGGVPERKMQSTGAQTPTPTTGAQTPTPTTGAQTPTPPPTGAGTTMTRASPNPKTGPASSNARVTIKRPGSTPISATPIVSPSLKRQSGFKTQQEVIDAAADTFQKSAALQMPTPTPTPMPTPLPTPTPRRPVSASRLPPRPMPQPMSVSSPGETAAMAPLKQPQTSVKPAVKPVEGEDEVPYRWQRGISEFDL